MQFSRDPTARGDGVADYVRSWYEANRESWWDRHGWGSWRRGLVADEFMIGLVQEVDRILTEAKKVESW